MDVSEIWFRAGKKFIKRNFGFELNWHEERKLYWYCKFCIGKEKISTNPITTYEKFVFDIFGLNVVELGEEPIYFLKKDGSLGDFDKMIGSGFLGTEEFKKYCRLHVGERRAERELI